MERDVAGARHLVCQVEWTTVVSHGRVYLRWSTRDVLRERRSDMRNTRIQAEKSTHCEDTLLTSLFR